MKGKLALWTIVVLSALLIVGIALACEDQPQEPTCSLGQITVTPAVWVPEVPATDGYCNAPLWNGRVVYKHDGNSANCSLRGEYSWLHQRPYRWDQTIQGAWVPGTPAVPGYWIAPVCRAPIAGCMDPLALNYNAAAEVDDGSCEYYVPPEPIPGCTDPLALNYDQAATLDDGTCQYPPAPIPGCTDPEALNYSVEATVDDGSCEYYIPPQPTPEPPFCGYTVTTWFQCNTGAAIWAQETGITPGEGTNFVGYAPYNRACPWCDDITGIYHREWRNTCDGSGWDEGTWNMPEEFHELNGCPLDGRCVQ